MMKNMNTCSRATRLSTTMSRAAVELAPEKCKIILFLWGF